MSETKQVLECRKTFEDGSICGVKLDCHLHDWRQKEYTNEILSDIKKKIEGMKINMLRTYTKEDMSKGVWAGEVNYNKALDSVLTIINEQISK